ncbi:MAG: glycosyl hydrolase [Ruminococcus sp.]
MTYLKGVYGSHISGQQEIYGGGHDNNLELEFDYIKGHRKAAGNPWLRLYELQSAVRLEDGTTERAISGQRIEMVLLPHRGTSTSPLTLTNMNWAAKWIGEVPIRTIRFPTAPLTHKTLSGGTGVQYFPKCMKDLAEQMTKLQDAGVPIILRPLHEAQGNEGNYSSGTAWFWWGDRGAEVYRTVEAAVQHADEKYNLHNIIWEYNSYNYANSDTWYPGDDYVDIVAYDKYNCDYNRDDGLSSGTPNLSAISPIFNYLYELTNGKKMVAMAENDSIPSEENMVIENAGWLYFCPWYGDHLMSSQYNDPAQLKKMYTSDYCITLDELPEDLYGSATPGTTTEQRRLRSRQQKQQKFLLSPQRNHRRCNCRPAQKQHTANNG